MVVAKLYNLELFFVFIFKLFLIFILNYFCLFHFHRKWKEALLCFAKLSISNYLCLIVLLSSIFFILTPLGSTGFTSGNVKSLIRVSTFFYFCIF